MAVAKELAAHNSANKTIYDFYDHDIHNTIASRLTAHINVVQLHAYSIVSNIEENNNLVEMETRFRKPAIYEPTTQTNVRVLTLSQTRNRIFIYPHNKFCIMRGEISMKLIDHNKTIKYSKSCAAQLSVQQIFSFKLQH